MNHVERIFSQGDASRLSGVTQDVLRDWRRREFLSGVGQASESGRWSYSFHEIIELAIVRILEGNGQSIRGLLYMANRLSLTVVAAFSPAEPAYDGWRRENTAFLFDEGGNMSTQVAAVSSPDDLADIFAASPQAILVNTAKLIAAMPEAITGMLSAAD